MTSIFFLGVSFIETQAQKTRTKAHSYGYAGLSNAESFAIVLFPDIQNMVQYAPSLWEGMPSYVEKNISSYNIGAVIGLGDNTNYPTANLLSEAKKGWDTIDSAGLPYVVCIGNHDYDSSLTTCGQVGSRSDTNFHKVFGPGNYRTDTWFGGASPDSSQNYYITFTAGSQEFVILALEFYPRDSILDWAQGVIDDNPDADVVLATHAYLNADGTVDRGPGGPQHYNLGDDCNSGGGLWSKFIKRNRKIGMVVCGHQDSSPYFNHLVSRNNDDDSVDQLFADYQDYPDPVSGKDTFGNGYMVLLEFYPEDSVCATTIDSTGKVHVVGATGGGAYTMPWPGSWVESSAAVREKASRFASCSVSQNFPNPFNPATMISYQLPVNSSITLTVYDVLGREVKTLINENENAGSHLVTFSGENLPSGVYFYRFRAGSFTEVRKMCLMK